MTVTERLKSLFDEENEDTLRRVSLAQGRLRKPGIRGKARFR